MYEWLFVQQFKVLDLKNRRFVYVLRVIVKLFNKTFRMHISPK
jgi:hypothetical protein